MESESSSGWPTQPGMSYANAPQHMMWTDTPKYNNIADSEVQMENDDEIYIPPDPGPANMYANQISLSQYEAQRRDYTKAAVDALIESRDYQIRHTRCHMCWHIWSEAQSTSSCVECGGYAMERPCPVCKGKCGSIWKRDVDMSHSQNEAHWDGECGLPFEEKQGYLMSLFLDETANEEDVLDDLKGLSTS